MAGTIKILFLAADPFEDRAPLRLAEEARAITQAIERGAEGSLLEIATCWALRIGDLQRALQTHAPRIVHFAGHGSQAGEIFLGDEYGSPRAVGGEALAKLFGLLQPRATLVVLNACDTARTAEAFSRVVDFTVAMNAPILDNWGILFAEAFYSSLACGYTVRNAFEVGVNRLELEGAPGATIPTLTTREGVGESVPIAPIQEQPPGQPPRGASPDEGQETSADVLEYDEVDFNNSPGSGRQVNRFGTMRGRRASFNNNAGPSAA